jgi:hypothetical protein
MVLVRRILIVLVAAAAASACGSSGGASSGGKSGSGGSSSAQPNRLTKAEYVRRADYVCGIYRIKLNRDTQQTRGLTNLSERAKRDRATVVADYRAQLASLQALNPRNAYKQEVDAALTQMQSAIDDLDHKLTSDPAATYAASYDPFHTAYNSLKQIGTTKCG